MDQEIRSGIPTIYRGGRFRSRLEARWAAFFDLIRWPWVYEPFDADGYIPDFLIQGAWPLVIEVGPVATKDEYVEKSRKADAAADSIGHDVLIVGVSPVVPFTGGVQIGNSNPTAGILGEHQPSADIDEGDGIASFQTAGFIWDTGVWGECSYCGQLGIVHASSIYCLRTCGHHQGGGWGNPVDVDWLRVLWARAGNDVQWKSRRAEALADYFVRQ